MIPKNGSSNFPYPGKAWVYFLLFALSNAVLAFALAGKAWISFFGIFLFLAWAALSMDPAPARNPTVGKK